MRQSHFKQAHQSDPPQEIFDLQDVAQDGVEALLCDLVQENKVAEAQKVLLASPNVLRANGSRHKLQMLAAFAASSDMLELLEESAEYDKVDLASKARINCIAESIKGHNGSTLRYLLSRVKPFFGNKAQDKPQYFFGSSDLIFRKGTERDYLIISQLVSNDWLEGMKIWAKWLRSGPIPTHGDSLARIKYLFGSKRTILAAASHSAGDQQLLCLWRGSGVVSLLDKKWASRTLGTVAQFSCSIALATHLLEHGADINGRVACTHKTSLHRAAGNTSAKGAEMIRFLLLNGADPEADLGGVDGKKIREEEGAKGIHRWLGKTWDELVEETKRIRHDKEAGKELMSKIDEEKEIAL